MGAALDGDNGAASKLFTDAVAKFGNTGFYGDEALALLDAVQLLPQDPAAGEWAHKSRTTFERLKARPFLELLDEAERATKAQAPASRSRVESVEAASEPA
jgi:hypothetical protein